MHGRSVIIAALAVYVLVVGCVLFPGGTGAQGDVQHGTGVARASIVPLTGLPYRGIAIQLQQTNQLDQYEKNIDEIAAVGADTVSLVVDARQENGSSSRIFVDMRLTLTPDQLGRLISHAKQKQLRVILMPIVLLDKPRGNEWRGTIRPENWDDWWDSYRQFMDHYAIIAQKYGVDALVVGSELVSTESMADQWAKTIDHARINFKGQLTYSANWDHYTSIPFWEQLDLIGMNSYYKLGDDRNVTVQEIVERWRNIQKDLLAFQATKGKPLLLLEAGWCSLANAAHEPWDYTKEYEGLDLELQRKLYEGFFRSWHGNPNLGGFIIWEWTSGEGGKEDRGYTPENKPAEKVLREWLAKPWKVAG